MSHSTDVGYISEEALVKKLLLIGTAVLLMATSASAARAAKVCVVADPSGTPLNIRAKPNGAIRGAVNNYTDVVIIEISNDRKWAKVAPVGPGEIGWAFMNYLDCNWEPSK